MISYRIFHKDWKKDKTVLWKWYLVPIFLFSIIHMTWFSVTVKCVRRCVCSFPSPDRRHQRRRAGCSLNILVEQSRWKAFTLRSKNEECFSFILLFHQFFISSSLIPDMVLGKREEDSLFLSAPHRALVNLFLSVIHKVCQWVFHICVIEFTLAHTCTNVRARAPSLFVAV